MAYTGKKYVSRREKKEKYERNTRIVLVAAGLILLILLFAKRVYIYDTIRLYF